jgi:hypothetical protein
VQVLLVYLTPTMMAGAPLKFNQALNWLTMAEKEVTTATAALQCARDELEALQRELEKAQKACVAAEQNMERATQEVACAQAEVETTRANADHIKQTEEENAAKALCLIDKMTREPTGKAFWYSPQLKRYGHTRLPSFLDRHIMLDVVLDHEKTHVSKLPGTNTFAIKCMSINGNRVVVFCDGDPTW